MTAIPLATRLRDSTSAMHRLAERSGFMKRLLTGRLERVSYCSLLRNLHALYLTLESRLECVANDAPTRTLGLSRLYRACALTDDLECLAGEGWAAMPLARAMADYQCHIERVAGEDELLLASHAYVRYMGDLSGGQLLRDIVRNSYGLAGATGTAFFSFAGCGDVGVLKEEFRAALNRLQCSPAIEERIVAEAGTAFEYHVRLFEELDDEAVTSDA